MLYAEKVRRQKRYNGPIIRKLCPPRRHPCPPSPLHHSAYLLPPPSPPLPPSSPLPPSPPPPRSGPPTPPWLFDNISCLSTIQGNYIGRPPVL